MARESKRRGVNTEKKCCGANTDSQPATFFILLNIFFQRIHVSTRK